MITRAPWLLPASLALYACTRPAPAPSAELPSAVAPSASAPHPAPIAVPVRVRPPDDVVVAK